MNFGFCPSQEPNQFQDALREAVLAEEAGYDGVFTTESHGSAVSQPAPLLRLAGLATHTSRVDLGTALVLLPLYHPVHVAEESALVDVMSGGHLILGLGAGRPPHWFETFGVSPSHRPPGWRRASRSSGACGLGRPWPTTASGSASPRRPSPPCRCNAPVL